MIKKLIKALFRACGYEISGLPGADVGIEIRKIAPARLGPAPQAQVDETGPVRRVKTIAKLCVKKLFRAFGYMIYSLSDGHQGIRIRKVRSFEKVKRIRQPKKIVVRQPVQKMTKQPAQPTAEQKEALKQREQQIRLLRIEQFYEQERRLEAGR